MGEPSVITKVWIVGRQEGQNERMEDARLYFFLKMGFELEECRASGAVEAGKQILSLVKWEEMQYSPAGTFVLDFWPPTEL